MTESIASIQEIQEILQNFITTGSFRGDGNEQYRIPTGRIYNGPPVAVITRQDVLRILQCFLDGEWDNQDAGSWCGALFAKYREYITYEAGYGTVIDDVISEMASFWNDMTPEEVKQLYDQLQNAQYNPNDPTT